MPFHEKLNMLYNREVKRLLLSIENAPAPLALPFKAHSLIIISSKINKELNSAESIRR